MYIPGRESDLQRFEKEQAEFQSVVTGFLVEGLNPRGSEQDFVQLRDGSIIPDIVTSVGGDEKDIKNLVTELYGAIAMHRKIYGRDPSPDQLAAVGSALSAFTNWDVLKAKKTDGSGKYGIIAEAVDNVATYEGNIHIVPQFMTIAGLIPLLTISPQFCHSVGAPLATDKVTVYELFEMVGANPYGVTVGTDINGLYNGDLSNTSRIKAVDETPNDVLVTFTSEPAYPIKKYKVFLYVNKRKIAVDNGSGSFNLIGDGTIKDDGTKVTLSSSTIAYATGSAGSETSTISVTFGAAIATGIPVWFGMETDVENYPAFVSETKYETRGFDLHSAANIIRTGVTLQAVLRTMRNHKLQLKDIAFSRLLQIVAADRDRETLRRINMFREGVQTFDKKLTNTGENAYEQWARVRETMNLLDRNMMEATDGASGVVAFLLDKNWLLLFKNMGSKYVKVAPTANNPELVNQPHYFGEFEGYQLFFNPGNASNEATGIGKGKRISECAAVLGTVTPPLPHQHGVDVDLSKRCTLYQEVLNDQPPRAFDYTTKM
ncbi:MAG: hypothetical protein ABIK68_17005, partial [bacterium]